jgi:protein-tyrosine phosphatase
MQSPYHASLSLHNASECFETPEYTAFYCTLSVFDEYLFVFRLKCSRTVEVMAWLLKGARTRGWQNEPPAKIHTNIIFGPGLYLNPGFVRTHNITHVVNCAFDKDSPLWFRTKFPDNYVCLEALDSMDENILKWYPKFEQTMNTFLRTPGSANIYVHCQCGINRSGFLALLFVCKKFGYSFELASSAILKQRPCALTNSEYKRQVKSHLEHNGEPRVEFAVG